MHWWWWAGVRERGSPGLGSRSWGSPGAQWWCMASGGPLEDPPGRARPGEAGRAAGVRERGSPGRGTRSRGSPGAQWWCMASGGPREGVPQTERGMAGLGGGPPRGGPRPKARVLPIRPGQDRKVTKSTISPGPGPIRPGPRRKVSKSTISPGPGPILALEILEKCHRLALELPRPRQRPPGADTLSGTQCMELWSSISPGPGTEARGGLGLFPLSPPAFPPPAVTRFYSHHRVYRKVRDPSGGSLGRGSRIRGRNPGIRPTFGGELVDLLFLTWKSMELRSSGARGRPGDGARRPGEVSPGRPRWCGGLGGGGPEVRGTPSGPPGRGWPGRLSKTDNLGRAPRWRRLEVPGSPGRPGGFPPLPPCSAEPCCGRR